MVQLKLKNNVKKNNNFKEKKDRNSSIPLLTYRTKRWIKATALFLLAIIISLSFWERSGRAGQVFLTTSVFLVGKAVYIVPLLFILGGLFFLKPQQKGKIISTFLGIFVVLFGVAGLLGMQNLSQKQGGWLGYLLSKALSGIFGFLVSNIIFVTAIILGFIIFSQFVWQLRPKEQKEKQSLLTRILRKQITLPIRIKESGEKTEGGQEIQPKISLFKEEAKLKNKKPQKTKEKYLLPPIDLLSKNEGNPFSGNIKQNSIIIKKTLENFGIPVEMTEVNVGPTVTQYAFKPAEGVKLSKITTLSNNLALALAAHPIRIEAPIPGKSLVGIEVPNKGRSIVALRNLIANNLFQNSQDSLLFCLGRNVSGAPMYAELGEMPHLLVAGATGTGKTIFLNSLILSLLYKNNPDDLRLILIDPKRVEFQNYNELPHLLCPVIYDASKTINALQWLTKEMERRFEIFSTVPTRNIITYNKTKSVIAANNTLPYIILIIDELADLMAARGREMEAGVVRLAQMARATGIHLVLATQRPSVEVITGLIKANITSRITFQVASQVDSRTVLDMAGAEKLLGSGDMLFISAKASRPRRIQAPFVSEKDVEKVTEFIKKQSIEMEEGAPSPLIDSLKNSLEQTEEKSETFFESEDPLYEGTKKLVLETKKASASFLQRRLRVGYARAARLIDMLEEKKIIGPADGAKPREVYGEPGRPQGSIGIEKTVEEADEDSDWQKV